MHWKLPQQKEQFEPLPHPAARQSVEQSKPTVQPAWSRRGEISPSGQKRGPGGDSCGHWPERIFTVNAKDDRGLVAAGKVTRVIVQVERFMEKTR